MAKIFILTVALVFLNIGLVSCALFSFCLKFYEYRCKNVCLFHQKIPFVEASKPVGAIQYLRNFDSTGFYFEIMFKESLAKINNISRSLASKSKELLDAAKITKGNEDMSIIIQMAKDCITKAGLLKIPSNDLFERKSTIDLSIAEELESKLKLYHSFLFIKRTILHTALEPLSTILDLLDYCKNETGVIDKNVAKSNGEYINDLLLTAKLALTAAKEFLEKDFNALHNKLIQKL